MSRGARAVALVLGVTAALLASPLNAVGSDGPNESVAAAQGPLTSGSAYAAAIERAADKDFFYFYVTALESTVSLAVGNGGGGLPGAALGARVVDALGNPLGTGISYLHGGESRTETVTLPMGKYFVEVAANEGFGDSYLLTPGGGPGAFGSYAEIASRCAAATARAAALQVGLSRAEGKLQRARNRFRRNRYNGREARRATHAQLVAAGKQVAAKKSAKRKAARARALYCGIPR